MSRHSKMVFEKLGRSYHLRVKKAEDLKHIVELDEAHWLATGAPVLSINMDEALLDYLDIDDNHRIMCFEVKRAIAWLLDILTDYQGITDESEYLDLEVVNGNTENGARIITSANKMLQQLHMSGSKTISLEQVREVKQKLGESRTSHAGVATAGDSADAKIREFIADIISTLGGIPEDAENEEDKGVSLELLDKFISEAAARMEWHAQTAIPQGKRNTELMPLGGRTHSAYQVYISVRDKIDQYFAQCEAVSFDSRIGEHIKPPEEKLKVDKVGDVEVLKDFMRESPLAVPGPNQMLRFSDPLNPYYATQIQKFRIEVMILALGQSMKNLTKEDWLKIKETFKVYEEWYGKKKGESVEKLGLEKLRVYLDERFRKEVSRIIANNNKSALVLDNINLVERAIVCQANMIRFVNNFVSFPHLYDPESRAVFEMGTLIIDGRRLSFSVKVEDRKAHSAIARTSDIFVLYAEIMLENNKDKYTVAVPVTSGTKGNICVGKRGIFCDLRGKLLDAKVVEIIENPISVGETLIAPFQRLGTLLTGKIEKMTTAAEKKLDAAASTAIASPKPQAQQPNKGLMAGGLLMGGGVAFAAVTSAITFFVKTVTGLGAAKTLGGIAVAVIAVIAPASIIALLKLRRRDLSAILEGVGWAINARMRLTFRQGRVFTAVPPRPGKTRIIRTRGGRVAQLLLWALLILTVVLCFAMNSIAEEPEWKRNVAFGLNVTEGNSDTSLYNIDVNAERKGSLHEFMLSGKYAYGETEDEATEDNANAMAQYNYLCKERTYLYLNADYKFDDIARIDYRITAGPGVGYYLLKKDHHSWSLEIGASYIEEKVDLTNSVPTVDDTTDSVNLRAVSRYEYKFSDTAKVWETIEYLPEFEDFDIYLINYELGAEAALNSKLSLRIVLEDKYDSDPAPGIEKNDVIIKSALVCNL